MKFGKDIFTVLGLAISVALASCTDHVAVNAVKLEQAREDSIVQAGKDNVLFDRYIADASNGIDQNRVAVGDFGVRRITWDPATSIKVPRFNDVVSVHYVGKFLDNDIFDTTNVSRAKKSDSLDYVAAGVSFEDLLAGSSSTYEEILNSLNASDEAIDNPQYSPKKPYLPIVFNHRHNGSGISPNFILGFRSGLREAMLEMQLHSRALIMIPSAVAYGTGGTATIPPDTPLLFEFSLVNIRP